MQRQIISLYRVNGSVCHDLDIDCCKWMRWQGLTLMSARKKIHGCFCVLMSALCILCIARAVRQPEPVETDSRQILMEEPPENKKIALTFDDGPHPVYTPMLLDGLKERGVRASFFILGQGAECYPDIVARMEKEGHLIGNHTYSHIQYSSKRELEFGEELVRTNEIVKDITGKDVMFVRPPYGSWNKKYETQLNMIPVLWSVDPLDWTTTNVTKVVKAVVSKVGENDIILLHDCYQSTVTATFEIIDILSKEGYEFVTVDELLLD